MINIHWVIIPLFLTQFLLTFATGCDSQESPSGDVYSKKTAKDETTISNDRSTDKVGNESGASVIVGNEDAEEIVMPTNCTGLNQIEADDFVLIGDRDYSLNNDNTINLPNGWRVEEVWGQGKISVSKENNATGLEFTNVGQFHGFKFSPPEVNGEKRRFSFKSAQIVAFHKVVASENAPDTTYGLRVIKPGEFEGAGGAPTTTWLNELPTEDSRFVSLERSCAEDEIWMPQEFMAADQSANRLIWEMQSSWTPSDVMIIYRIVLKDFRWL